MVCRWVKTLSSTKFPDPWKCVCVCVCVCGGGGGWTNPDWSNKQFTKQETEFKIISEDCWVVLLIDFWQWKKLYMTQVGPTNNFSNKKLSFQEEEQIRVGPTNNFPNKVHFFIWWSKIWMRYRVCALLKFISSLKSFEYSIFFQFY